MKMIEYYIEKLAKRRNTESPDPAPKTYMLTESPDEIPEGLGTIDFRTLKLNESPRERALAFLWRNGETLHVCAVMEDSDVFNTAREKNEKTWTTGDVMEFFIKPSNTENYYELHLTPNNATLELDLPGAQKRLGLELEEMFFDSGFKYEAGAFVHESGLNGWHGCMAIPFKSIGLSEENLKGSTFSVCRYNYWRDEEKPEQTSTSYYPEGGFHQPEYWHSLL
jgi:hypothetical protein